MIHPHPRPAGLRRDIHLPPERFYWGFVEAPTAVRPRRAGGIPHPKRSLAPSDGLVPEGARVDLLEQVPLPLDQLHAVCVRVPRGLLICAMSRTELAVTDADRLTPCAIPGEIVHVSTGPDVPDAETLSAWCESLNLRIGEFEPSDIRRRRSLIRATRLVAAGVALMFTSVGLHRRAVREERIAAASAGRAADIVKTTLAPGVPPAAFDAEAARIRHAEEAVHTLAPPPDAAVTLAALLQQWPAGSPAQPQSIAVSEHSASIAVLLRDPASGQSPAEDATAFIKSFAPPAGWTLREPVLVAGTSFVRVHLELSRVPEPGGNPAMTATGVR